MNKGDKVMIIGRKGTGHLLPLGAKGVITILDNTDHVHRVRAEDGMYQWVSEKDMCFIGRSEQPKTATGVERNYASLLRTNELFNINIAAEMRELFPSLSLSISSKKKETTMSRLLDIPKRIKELLSKGDRALRSLQWIDEDLDLTNRGGAALSEFLYDKFHAEFAEYAIKEEARIKKEEAEEKE